MSYGKKSYGQKKSFSKGGAKPKYVPGLKDGYNNFITSLVGLPFRTLNGELPVPLDSVIETLKSKEKVTVKTAILALFGITDPEHIPDALVALFNPADPKEMVNLGYKISNFEKLLEYQTPEYKAAGLEAIEAIKEIAKLK